MPSKKRESKTKPTHGGKRAGSGRKPDEYKQLQALVRSDKMQDALDSWEFIKRVRDGTFTRTVGGKEVSISIDWAVRLRAAQYLISQVIGQPPQALTVQGEMKLLVVGGSEWTPGK